MYDRRTLEGTIADVLLLWKSTISKKLTKVNREADFDAIVQTAGNHICRRCLYAYQRVLKAQDVIEENVTKAIRFFLDEAAASEPAVFHAPDPKRHRSAPPVVFGALSFGIDSESPDVAECHSPYTLIFWLIYIFIGFFRFT